MGIFVGHCCGGQGMMVCCNSFLSFVYTKVLIMHVLYALYTGDKLYIVLEDSIDECVIFICVILFNKKVLCVCAEKQDKD